MQIASTSLQLEHHTQDLLLRRCWKSWDTPALNFGISSEATVCHSQQNHSSSLSARFRKCWQPSGFVKANEMGIPSLTVTNVLRFNPFYEANHAHAPSWWSWNCRSVNKGLYKDKSQLLPSLQKAVGRKQTAMPKRKPLTWFKSVNQLGLSNWLFRKETIDAKVRDLLETTRNAFYIDGSRLLCSHGSQS